MWKTSSVNRKHVTQASSANRKHVINHQQTGNTSRNLHLVEVAINTENSADNRDKRPLQRGQVSPAETMHDFMGKLWFYDNLKNVSASVWFTTWIIHRRQLDASGERQPSESGAVRASSNTFTIAHILNVPFDRNSLKCTLALCCDSPFHKLLPRQTAELY